LITFTNVTEHQLATDSQTRRLSDVKVFGIEAVRILEESTQPMWGLPSTGTFGAFMRVVFCALRQKIRVFEQKIAAIAFKTAAA